MEKPEERNKRIGVFDSGFGGLFVLRKIAELLPEYDYLYLADTARAPYGSLRDSRIYENGIEAVDYMFAQGCELIVIACNTVSCRALSKIQSEFLPGHYPDKRVLGVIIPTIEAIAAEKAFRKIGLLGTEATVKSGKYELETEKIDPGIKIFPSACPGLVPMIESGNYANSDMEEMIREYLKPLLKNDIDAIILGCTHYEALKGDIERISGPEIKIIAQSEIVASKLKSYLARHQEIEKKIGKNGAVEFYTTGSAKKFEDLGGRFYGNCINAKKVNLKYSEDQIFLYH